VDALTLLAVHHIAVTAPRSSHVLDVAIVEQNNVARFIFDRVALLR
jgi:hypothetical protein